MNSAITEEDIINSVWMERILSPISCSNCNSWFEETKDYDEYFFCSWTELHGHIHICSECVLNKFHDAFFKAFLLGNVKWKS